MSGGERERERDLIEIGKIRRGGGTFSGVRWIIRARSTLQCRAFPLTKDANFLCNVTRLYVRYAVCTNQTVICN